ncbi:NKG2-A/NKG2-B type II integral membrane protein-like [Talpa occidentalis]|uniref:NKG2-A/NKG2-B type II integral membrane protein-like n=1 Tax=Talpa occidentalis TaxID=50954 RepID=UPI00188FF1DB|nr:NKG2-A/NKG2-B type II integral membrane protein-like [Talpa occidentalis]
MNEQRVTYAELKLAKVSKRPQVKPKESKSSTTGMEQGVTYAELSLHNAARDPQENGKSCHLKGLAAPPEKCIAGILGLTCLVLICIIVPVWIKFPVAPTEDPEKKVSSTVTESQKGCPAVVAQDPSPQGAMAPPLKFMNSISVSSWIGVYRNGSDQPWTFVNGSTSHTE